MRTDPYVTLDLNACLHHLGHLPTTPPPVRDLLDLAQAWEPCEGGFRVHLRRASNDPDCVFTYSREAIAAVYGEPLLHAIDALYSHTRYDPDMPLPGAEGNLVRLTWWHQQAAGTVPHLRDEKGLEYVDHLSVYFGGDTEKDTIDVFATTYRMRTAPSGVAHATDHQHGLRALPVAWFEQFFPGARQRLDIGLELGLVGERLVDYVCNPVPPMAIEVLPDNVLQDGPR